MLKELTKRFESVKQRNPLHVNELLDYLQRSYVYGELSIVEYKNFYRELDQLNAEKPQSFEFAMNL
ncbi:YppF family protein [Niallia sp. Krafla_26]|uniref:YppF family protein n=1 Tax=Niallia sp. Krafla_26 TaxID=3064703 RepID=UPI003D17793D